MFSLSVPLVMVCVFVKLACNYALVGIKDDIADISRPDSFDVGFKGGCEE